MGPFALILAAASFFVAWFPIDTIRNQGVAMVQGTAYDVYRHRRVAGAEVYAVSDTDAQTTMTDKNGRFYFLALRPGNYRFFTIKSGYGPGCLAPDHVAELGAGFEYSVTLQMFIQCT